MRRKIRQNQQQIYYLQPSTLHHRALVSITTILQPIQTGEKEREIMGDQLQNNKCNKNSKHKRKNFECKDAAHYGTQLYQLLSLTIDCGNFADPKIVA